MTCKCGGCPTKPKDGQRFCSWCIANLFAKKATCHGSSICFLSPCSGRVMIGNDYRVTHYVEVGHDDPSADDERALRKAGLHDFQARRHPKNLSPLDSFDAS